MSEELVILPTGEVVDPNDESQCVRALLAVRDFEQKCRDAKSALTAAIVERSKVLGTKTILLPDGSKAEVKGGQETVYDAQELEDGLRALGMPEERIREIVSEEISYKVRANEAKRAAAANEDYAAVIASSAHVVEKPSYVSVTKK